MKYQVNDQKFESYLEAIEFAQANHAEVVEIATGLRRWWPVPKKLNTRRVRHVLVNADGTKTEFSKVRR